MILGWKQKIFPGLKQWEVPSSSPLFSKEKGGKTKQVSSKLIDSRLFLLWRRNQNMSLNSSKYNGATTLPLHESPVVIKCDITLLQLVTSSALSIDFAYWIPTVKVVNGDYETAGHCDHHKFASVAKHPNCDYMIMGMLQFQGPVVNLLFQHHHNFKRLHASMMFSWEQYGSSLPLLVMRFFNFQSCLQFWGNIGSLPSLQWLQFQSYVI